MKSNALHDFAVCPLLRVTGIFFLGLLITRGPSAYSMDLVTIERDGKEIILRGEIIVKAQDGGLMLRSPDGKLWLLQPQEIKSHSTDAQPFEGLDPGLMANRLAKELPATAGKFRQIKSKGLVILYNTSPVFANWVKGIYLRLTVAFKNFWKNQGNELSDADVPLCVIIFKSKSEFDDYSRATLGSAQGDALAYYNIQTNQVVMYDLTGVGQFGGRRISSSGQLNQILQQPSAESMVATIVHEAVHQIAYNSGLQNRFGPYPFWLNEGLAMFFEVPDLKSRRGWNGIGKINHVRLDQIKLMIRSGKAEILDEILQSDKPFRNPEQSLNAYAEAWALNFYLIQREPKKFLAYLNEMNAMTPLTELTSTERLEMFVKHFGDVDSLKDKCLKFILR